MRHQLNPDEAAAIAQEIDDTLREEIRLLVPTQRRWGRHLPWQHESVRDGKLAPAGPLSAILAAAIVNPDVATDVILGAIDRLRLIAERRRAGDLPGDWTQAFLAETAREGAANHAQATALATRSTGDKRAARAQLLRHRGMIDLALKLLDQSIADDDDARTHAGRRLREMLPAS